MYNNELLWISETVANHSDNKYEKCTLSPSGARSFDKITFE